MTDKPYPFTPEQEAWLQDLETTEEPQTIHYLHAFEEFKDLSVTIRPGYCCLGRACVVLGIPEEKCGSFGRFDHQSGRLSDKVADQLHLRVGRQGRLISLNDSGRSFKQIAAYIRANPENVFLPPEEDKE